MSKWRDKSETALASMLGRNERILRKCDGISGIRDGFIVLTDRRVLIFCAGPTIFSEPRGNEIYLQHIISVNLHPGMMGSPPELVINSRSGTFGFKLRGPRGMAGNWPNWILGAQEGEEGDVA